MQNLLEELKSTLEIDDRLVIDGKLNKNKIVEMALALDGELLTLLLKNDTIKKHFFKEVSGTLIFDKIEFQRFVSNKQFLPDSYTAFKNKIGLTANGEYLTESKEVVLAWPYKDCVLEGGQTKEDQKRKEIFWNATLAPDEIDRLLDPKVLTNFKKYDKDGERKAKSISIKDNLILKGNNLLALHSLKKSYTEKVKLIYIDPPFNTGSDSFQYNDSFNHSSWLTFMKDRLLIARDLLHPKGSIFIQVDDNEAGYIKVLLDEIFGAENFCNEIIATTNKPFGFKGTSDGLFKQANHIYLYAKNKAQFEIKKVWIEKDYDKAYNMVFHNMHKPESEWSWESIDEAVASHLGYSNKKDALKTLSKEEFEDQVSRFALENADKVFQTAAVSGGAFLKRKKTIEQSSQQRDRLFRHPDDDMDYLFLKGRRVIFYSERLVNINGASVPGELITDTWTDISIEGIAGEGKVNFQRGKKPEKLIARIVEMATEPGDLILDFFAGSGTTGAVAMKSNRNFIITEQLDYIDELPVNRLQKVISGEQTGVSKYFNWQGGGSFIYAELKQSNATFVEQIEAAKDTGSLWKIWEQMQETGFISYRIQPKTINAEKSSFEELSLEEQKQFLIELLDKNQLYVNYSEIDDETYKVSEEEKKLNHQFYKLK